MGSELKYGYVITSTPGLIDDGKFLLSYDGIKNGEVEAASPYPADEEMVAVYPTKGDAEKAMMGLVPSGSTPGVFAGLEVESAYPLIAERMIDGLCVGVGFSIPS